MMLLLTRSVLCILLLSCSVLLSGLFLSCLAEPRISTRACFCQPCLAVLGTLPSSPILRLGGPQDLPLLKNIHNRFSFSLSRQSTVLPPEPSPMPARVDDECMRLTGHGAIDGSTHSLTRLRDKAGRSVRGAERRSDTVPCNFKNSHLTDFR